MSTESIYKINLYTFHSLLFFFFLIQTVKSMAKVMQNLCETKRRLVEVHNNLKERYCATMKITNEIEKAITEFRNACDASYNRSIESLNLLFDERLRDLTAASAVISDAINSNKKHFSHSSIVNSTVSRPIISLPFPFLDLKCFVR